MKAKCNIFLIILLNIFESRAMESRQLELRSFRLCGHSRLETSVSPKFINALKATGFEVVSAKCHDLTAYLDLYLPVDFSLIQRERNWHIVFQSQIDANAYLMGDDGFVESYKRVLGEFNLFPRFSVTTLRGREINWDAVNSRLSPFCFNGCESSGKSFFTNYEFVSEIRVQLE